MTDDIPQERGYRVEFTSEHRGEHTYRPDRDVYGRHAPTALLNTLMRGVIVPVLAEVGQAVANKCDDDPKAGVKLDGHSFDPATERCARCHRYRFAIQSTIAKKGRP